MPTHMRVRILSSGTVQGLETELNEYTLNGWTVFGILTQDHVGVFHHCIALHVEAVRPPPLPYRLETENGTYT